jgi:hypothetical protein
MFFCPPGRDDSDALTALRARLGFRAIADREPFAAGIGESITKTRRGLLPAITTPMAPAQVQDFTSGLTPQNYSSTEHPQQQPRKRPLPTA